MDTSADDHFQRQVGETQPDPKERFARLRLIRSRRVGLSTFYRLLAEHGSAGAALKALPDLARNAGAADYAPCPEKIIHAELKAGAKAGAEIVIWGDSFYPKALTDIPDPPAAFWCRGDLRLLAAPAVALVGARNASSLGLRMARQLASGLGKEGICVVSGLARGIDTSAHQGALKYATIGVMAGGIDEIYPPENNALAEDMAQKGLLIAEQPPGVKPTSRLFPKRNRIISGLSQAVVVVEAALKSGSMITARNALDQGREVMAVPGHPIDPRAGACNALIRDGAALIRGARDILSLLQPLDTSAAHGQLPKPAARTAEAETPSNQDSDVSEPDARPSPPKRPPSHHPNRHPRRRPLGETAALHTDILSTLTTTPVPEDQLVRDLNVTLPDLDLLLTRLEIDGKIERKSGGMLCIVSED